MNHITKDAARKIIEDFAKEIDLAKLSDTKPEKAVIDFRDERSNNVERTVYRVPIELLRYRKDNGRIASDVYSYEKDFKVLSEKDDDDQKILAQFLKAKDPDQTEKLKNSLIHRGQELPAVITCDGFLINGNRRKMVYEMLWDTTHEEKYKRMKVVILPGLKDAGGPPTIKEIEQIENRYQLQSDGKSEYSSFDRALSIRRKIEFGMSLEEQLKDDPNFVSLTPAAFKKKVDMYEEDYLKPLESIDKYLESLGREGVYKSISSGIGDKEGKWQAFLDYYKYVFKKINNDKDRIRLNIDEDEVGKIEDVAFKLIRFREFPGLKVHQIMRDLHKCLSNSKAKEELLEICNVDTELPSSEMVDDTGKELEHDILDKKWIKKNRTEIIRQVTKARDIAEHGEEMETPLSLLDQAYKKLNHKLMNPDAINIADAEKAMKLAERIEERAREIKHEFYEHHKSKDKLLTKFKRP